MDGLPGDVFVFIGREKEDGAGDFFRCACEAHRDLRHGGGPSLVGIAISTRGVVTRPGATAFTLMPSLTTSNASESVKAATPAFAAA